MNDNDNTQTQTDELNTISLGSIPDNANNVNVPLSSIPPVKPVEPIPTVDASNEPLPVQTETKKEEVVALEPINMEVEPVAPIPMEEPEPQSVAEEVVDPLLNVDIPPVFDDIGTVPPLTQVDPVPVEPAATTSVEPVAPISYDVPETIGSAPVEPIFNDIGTVPPIPDAPILVDDNNSGKKAKKKVNKTIFVMIIVLVIAAVGVTVYVLLGIANRGDSVSSPVNLKEVNIELGSEISTVITDYATFNGISSDSCSLNTTEIGDNLNEIYPFTITCNGVSYQGKAKVVDTTSPEVSLKEVTAGINSEVKPEDFVESCDDKTGCSYEFKDKEAVKKLLETVGIYKNQVVIIAKDEAGNSKEFNASLIVSGDAEPAASVYLVCTKASDSLLEVNRLGIDSGNLVGSITREYTFSFANVDEYNTAKGSAANNTDMTYQSITGKVSFDDANNKFTITKIVTYEELNEEAGSTLSKSFLDISAYYGSKGFSCELK